MTEIVIREAAPSDAAQLAELRYEFRSALGGAVEDKDAFLKRCSAWMSGKLSAGWRCWVVTSGGTIVGQVWLHLLEKLPNPGGEPELHGYVTNLYVRPEFRGGVGGRLLAQVMNWLKGQRVDSVFLWPTPRSRSLYRRQGFQEPADILELRRGKPWG